ncbi:unnamed protein product [Meloidogyne enterolobii]|uniref:Uncharacterized protein n=1 Tax=Meloidogyne enterolobii TaxID=390850 RepID=A0ACB0Y4G8_MELEN
MAASPTSCVDISIPDHSTLLTTFGLLTKFRIQVMIEAIFVVKALGAPVTFCGKIVPRRAWEEWPYSGAIQTFCSACGRVYFRMRVNCFTFQTIRLTKEPTGASNSIEMGAIKVEEQW